jgi:hypothetical protein
MRTLHLEYKEHDYHLLANVGSILKNLNFAVRGLDRSYLRLDPDSMGRNLGGPLRTCLMQGIYHSQIIHWCTRRMLRFGRLPSPLQENNASTFSATTVKNEDDKKVTVNNVAKAHRQDNTERFHDTSDDSDDVNLGSDAVALHFMKSIKDMVACMLYVPLTVTAILASCHVWMLTNVLDISYGTGQLF